MARTRTPSKRFGGVYFYLNAKSQKRWGAVVDLGSDWATGKRRQERKEGFATQDEAATWQAEVRRQRRSGQRVEPSTEPLGLYLERWLVTQEARLRPNTVYGYRSTLNRIAPLFPIPLANLRVAEIERIEHALIERGYRPTTVQVTHAVLSAALKDAVRLELLPRNPCAAVEPPAGGPRKPTTWDIDQMRRFLAHTADEPYWGTLWAVMCECWIRIGELQELQWGDINLPERTITISRTATRNRDGTDATGPAKTESGERVIRISDPLCDRLESYRGDRPATGYVFPAGDGRRITRGAVAAMLAASCQSAGVPILTPHQLRHSGGSVAHASGADYKLMSERLGHADISTTMRTYVHTKVAGHRQLADQLGALLGDETPREGPENEAM